LYSCYGFLSNERLLYAYGFCKVDNENESVPLKLRVANHVDKFDTSDAEELSDVAAIT
jgi:hypothetical protein